MDNSSENGQVADTTVQAPGIVIHNRFEPLRPPAILRFIWGGKVRPTPSLPFGRATA